jgi:hypothetical protein
MAENQERETTGTPVVSSEGLFEVAPFVAESPPAPTVEPLSLTEADVLAMLVARHATVNGNGPRWAFATHVRDQAGWHASRTLDAVAMDTWMSSGLALHGYEVKVSRSDWLRELAEPAKAEAFLRFVDYFWIAAPKGIVREGELPDGWGLLETTGRALRCSVKARRGESKPLDRSFVASLLRAATRRALPTTDAERPSPDSAPARVRVPEENKQ